MARPAATSIGAGSSPRTSTAGNSCATSSSPASHSLRPSGSPSSPVWPCACSPPCSGRPSFRAIAGQGYPLTPRSWEETGRLSLFYVFYYMVVLVLPLAAPSGTAVDQLVAVAGLAIGLLLVYADYVIVFEGLAFLPALRRSVRLLSKRWPPALAIFVILWLVAVGLSRLYGSLLRRGRRRLLARPLERDPGLVVRRPGPRPRLHLPLRASEERLTGAEWAAAARGLRPSGLDEHGRLGRRRLARPRVRLAAAYHAAEDEPAHDGHRHDEDQQPAARTTSTQGAAPGSSNEKSPLRTAGRPPQSGLHRRRLVTGGVEPVFARRLAVRVEDRARRIDHGPGSPWRRTARPGPLAVAPWAP